MQGYNLSTNSAHADQFDGHQEHKNKEVKPIQTSVSLFFQSNSNLLTGFMEAIEHKIIN